MTHKKCEPPNRNWRTRTTIRRYRFLPKEIEFNKVYSGLTCGDRTLNSRFLRSSTQWAAPSYFETFLEKLAFFISPLSVSGLLTNLACLRVSDKQGQNIFHSVATRHFSTSSPRWCSWKLPQQVQCVSVYTVRLNVVRQRAHSWGQLAGV